MLIKLNDGSRVEIEEGATAFDLALKLKFTSPAQGLGVSINGETYDLVQPLQDGDEVSFWDFDDGEGKEMFWHTSAHILAQAVLRLWPEAKPTIGPPIENGFYYDFANLTISDTDFDRIEKEMKAIVAENFKPQREVFESKEEAKRAFADNPYKCELIDGFPDGAELTGYRQGEFFDLCRGPHIPNLGKVKALKLMKTSGSYWRGDSDNEVLTRIYGITFPDRKLLKGYLEFLEEVKKRDHKVIGPQLDLFSVQEEAPGMPFIHAKGMIVWNRLMQYWKECHDRARYQEIKTPVMMIRELWEKSGHWANYRENMYSCSVDEREYAIKPMNCPGAMLHYGTRIHSYREFPLRVAEVGTVHRHELSGAVSGLFRVRCFHQDDAHIFMQPEDIEDEILNVLALVDEMYSTFGLTYTLELSTKPEKNTIGSDEEWEVATTGLRNALERTGREFRINEGDGAFYGPKIDIHIRDALGRTWQCGTIQLDMALPERFDLEYVANDGERKRPVMIHRVVYGSIERFLGILIEHFAGKFPLWMSPSQIILLPVADRHVPYAEKVRQRFEENGFNCEIDDSHESVSKKVRNAQLNKFNYMLTIGDRELESETVALRTRDNVVHGAICVEEFLKQIVSEREHRDLGTPFVAKPKEK